MKYYYAFLNIIFGLILGLEGNDQSFYDFLDSKNQCLQIDTSKIGLIYLYVPYRQLDAVQNYNPSANKLTFKTHHYYSLLTLCKLFKPTPKNRLLFYYVNDSGEPTNNHYNQWLNDTHWNSKLPIDAVKFIKIESNQTNNFDIHEIVSRIKHDSVSKFDTSKEKFLLITSDIIIGPKIQSCFTRDVIIKDSTDFLSIEYIKSQTQQDCYKALNEKNDKNYYSFLYNLDYIHYIKDFSGIFLWNYKFTQDITPKVIDFNNVYKCTYRNDVIKTFKYPYEDTFCVFGFELNAYESPVFQELFTNNDNYFKKIVRSYLFNNSEPVSYTSSSIEVIPNVVHLIWFSSNPYKRLKFIEYLCLKSILHVLKPDKIRIHGDIEPYSCEYWDELSKNPKIEWVYRERPLFKYGQNFSSSPIQHLADVARLEVLYEEGGIYSDFDILWVKPLDKFRYINVDLIAANDITSYCPEFPFNIQIGTFLARKNSDFIKKWLNGYKEKYHHFPGDYVAVSMCEPYKLYEKFPNRVYIENRLQMIYFNGWSSFIPKYVEIEQEKLKEFNENLDWLNDGAYGYHLPRHGDLYTRLDYEKADKNSLPIRIASYILNF